MDLQLENIGSFLTLLKEKIGTQDIIVLLRGDLASGKTTLVKEFVRSIGIKDEVTSPTFSLQSVYDETIYHYDMYNKTLHDFIALGLLEEFEKKGIHFVEWGEKDLESILREYGFDFLVVNIKKKKESREYSIES